MNLEPTLRQLDHLLLVPSFSWDQMQESIAPLLCDQINLALRSAVDAQLDLHGQLIWDQDFSIRTQINAEE
jgi:hypothetical protein